MQSCFVACLFILVARGFGNIWPWQLDLSQLLPQVLRPLMVPLWRVSSGCMCQRCHASPVWEQWRNSARHHPDADFKMHGTKWQVRKNTGFGNFGTWTDFGMVPPAKQYSYMVYAIWCAENLQHSNAGVSRRGLTLVLQPGTTTSNFEGGKMVYMKWKQAWTYILRDIWHITINITSYHY